MSERAQQRHWLLGRRFIDEEQEFEVMRIGVKRWKRSVIDVVYYCTPEERTNMSEWEWSTAEEVEEFVKKSPLLDDGFAPTLGERADELDTHPLAQEEVETSEFWAAFEEADQGVVNAKEAETFFNDQRTDPYLNGLLDGNMYGALFSLAELARGVQNALLLKPVRKGVRDDDDTFCSFVNTTGEVVVNSQSFEMLKALMWLAGFREHEFPRGISKWKPIVKGKVATTIIKRLIGIEALKTGVNALVKIETFKRSDVSIPAGRIMNPMLATDAEMCVFLRLVCCLCLNHSDVSHHCRRRYAKAPLELGSLAVGPDGKCLPAWLLRHVLEGEMITKPAPGDPRLAAYSAVCADKAKSVFEIICSPRKLSGPQGDKAARFVNGASVRVRFSFQLHTRGWPRNPKQDLLARFGALQ